jgi:hypothetical protein
LEQTREEAGVALEEVQRPVAHAGRAVHQEQAAGHESGKALNAAVVALIGGEIVFFESGGQGDCLTEAEGEALAGDGVDGTGGVADESDVA